jgi:hypothetical protein
MTAAGMPSFLRRTFIVLAGIALVATVQAALRPDGRWDAQYVYSFATGLLIWGLLETVRWAYGSPRDVVVPVAAAPLAWCGVAIVLGFVIGSLVGDAYLGKSTFELMQHRFSYFLGILGVTVLASLGGLMWFQARLNAQRLALQMEAQRAAVAQAQLRLLQGQLEPHMIFNTLANLRALIETDPPRALDMLDRFNAWLRGGLAAMREGDASKHTVAQEFAQLDDYIALMRVRMGERLQVQVHLDERVRKLPLPPMLLQPWVENAIQHGLEPKAGEALLELRGEVIDRRVSLSVRDNGLGWPAGAAEGYGLVYVRERVAAAFGMHAYCEREDVAGGGTRWTMSWPFAEVTA